MKYPCPSQGFVEFVPLYSKGNSSLGLLSFFTLAFPLVFSQTLLGVSKCMDISQNLTICNKLFSHLTVTIRCYQVYQVIVLCSDKCIAHCNLLDRLAGDQVVDIYIQYVLKYTLCDKGVTENFCSTKGLILTKTGRLFFRKFKVALNPMYRICLNFAKSCISSCLSKFYNKKKFYQAVFEI